MIVNRTETTVQPAISRRLQSLDFFRGFIMVSLMLGETEIFQRLKTSFPNKFFELLSDQFEHSKWHGLRFWDMLLPTFMFLAGCAMAFSYTRQSQKPGFTWTHAFRKTLRRVFWLMFWGVLVYAVRDHHINLQFSNVLCQLSLGTLIVILIIRLSAGWQFTISLLCLLIPELLYRFAHIPGFDQPFVTEHNFGNYIDLVLIGHVNGHYSPAFDMLPCSVYLIWGMMAGNILQSTRPEQRKVSILTIAGIISIVIGVVMDVAGVTPILKWLISSSFVFVTAGAALVGLALLYCWIDIRKHTGRLTFFTIVGKNSIFIYLVMTFLSGKVLFENFDPILTGLATLSGVSANFALVISAAIMFALEWLLCNFLYKKKLFFKL